MQVKNNQLRTSLYERLFKRVFDVVVTMVGLVIFTPVILIAAVLIAVKLGRPIIFKQKRPGLNNAIFTMYKFRSMNDARDESGELLPDHQRLTKFGQVLRSTSIDELPELINVLKGDMSLVGPRPQLVKDLVFMSEDQKKRHGVMPGITGYAQVNGRNGVSWEEKLDLDLVYVENISLWGDLRILFKTVFKVFLRDDVNSSGMATAEDFGDYLLRSKKITQREYDDAIAKYKELVS